MWAGRPPHCTPRGGGSTSDLSDLKGIDHRDIIGSVFAPSPVWDKDICRFPPLAWQQEASLLGGGKRSSNCCAMEGVPETIVPCYSFSLPGTVESMVTKLITRPPTGRAWTLSAKHW